jgi:hypothetical protein
MSTELMPENSGNIEKEIALLEQKLAEKKAILGQPENISQKEILSETIKERMVETPVFGDILKISPKTSKIKKPTPTPLVATGKVSVQELRQLPKEKQLDILVGLAMTQSIPEAVALAQESGSPYVLDELHDVLVDKFFEELVKRGKL